MNSTAAIWSAIAAFCAALCSFLIFLIQRRNLIESVRPELVLIGWTRKQEGEGDNVHEVIGFQSIKNVGRGVALHVNIGAFDQTDFLPITVSATKRLPVLAVNDSVEVNSRILVWWQNVKSRNSAESHKYVSVTIPILCWDSRGLRYETRYNLFVIPLSRNIGLGEEIAPGVALTNRTVTTKAPWLLKSRKQFNQARRLPRNLWTRLREKLQLSAGPKSDTSQK